MKPKPKYNRLNHRCFDILEQAIKNKSWNGFKHDKPFPKARFFKALKEAHPFVYDAQCTEEAMAKSSKYGVLEDGSRNIKVVRDVVEELSFIEEFSIPFKSTLYVLSKAPVVIVAKDEYAPGQAFRIQIHGYLVEEETPEKITIYPIAEHYPDQSTRDKFQLSKDSCIPMLDFYEIDLRMIDQARNAEETLLIYQLTKMVSVKRIGIEHYAGRSMQNKESPNGFTVIKYDNVYHIANKVPYDYKASDDEGEINWEFSGFWRGHWRAFYVKDSRGNNTKDRKDWNVVDYGRIGKNRQNQYVVPGYTWVTEHIKGDRALAEIKPHYVKHG